MIPGYGWALEQYRVVVVYVQVFRSLSEGVVVYSMALQLPLPRGEEIMFLCHLKRRTYGIFQYVPANVGHTSERAKPPAFVPPFVLVCVGC